MRAPALVWDAIPAPARLRSIAAVGRRAGVVKVVGERDSSCYDGRNDVGQGSFNPRVAHRLKIDDAADGGGEVRGSELVLADPASAGLYLNNPATYRTDP